MRYFTNVSIEFNQFDAPKKPRVGVPKEVELEISDEEHSNGSGLWTVFVYKSIKLGFTKAYFDALVTNGKIVKKPSW